MKILVVLALVVCGAWAPASDDNARRLIEAGIAAMGGEARLRALRAIHLEAIGRRNALEQSERPEGPWIGEWQEIVEDRDVRGARMRRTTSSRFATFAWSQTLVVADGVVAIKAGERAVPWMPGAAEWLELEPERVLLTALDAPDARVETDTTLQSVPHHQIVFTWRGAPVRLLLNANTGLPTAVETTRPWVYDYYHVWGDVTTRTLYSMWMHGAGGVHYPMQWDVERNGQPSQTVAIQKIAFDGALDDAAFAIPDDVKAAYRAKPMSPADTPLGRPNQPPSEIAPGVVQIPAGFNTALIRQTDGVVIVESPLSSAYSAKVIEEAGRRFPGVPIKGVITTSDAWPHFGGLREYVARKIPVYALDVNLPILNRLLAAPFRTAPDALARAPRKPDFRVVSKKTVVGDGENRLELYPIRTETGERQMMVYLPGRRLLYASDLAQPSDGNMWMGESYDELRVAVEREKLAVDTVFAMHLGPVAWADLLTIVRKAVEGN